jgi:hypothetical protein
MAVQSSAQGRQAEVWQATHDLLAARWTSAFPTNLREHYNRSLKKPTFSVFVLVFVTRPVPITIDRRAKASFRKSNDSCFLSNRKKPTRILQHAQCDRYTLIKLRLLEPLPAPLAALAGRPVYLVRPSSSSWRGRRKTSNDFNNSSH